MIFLKSYLTGVVVPIIIVDLPSSSPEKSIRLIQAGLSFLICGLTVSLAVVFTTNFSCSDTAGRSLALFDLSFAFSSFCNFVSVETKVLDSFLNDILRSVSSLVTSYETSLFNKISIRDVCPLVVISEALIETTISLAGT